MQILKKRKESKYKFSLTEDLNVSDFMLHENGFMVIITIIINAEGFKNDISHEIDPVRAAFV